MPLLALWNSNPDAIKELVVEQVVATAGDGVLKDGTACSKELRAYLAQVESNQLATYIERCLTSSFPKSGLVLQDLVNELARRLDFNVTNGRYQGTTNAVGYDGIWVSPEGRAIVAEVKTTDAYRMSLDTLAKYRQELVRTGEIDDASSILIVVGREDTGELEAQVRGSRHAWDIRLISADALINLVQLKENANAPDTDRKIRSLLTPMENTRLDSMVDVLFTAAVDVAQSDELDEEGDENVEGVSDHTSKASSWQFTDTKLLDAKRADIVAAIGRKLRVKLIKKSRALYWDADHETRIVCTVSKRYDRSWYRYWYAYHPPWDLFLAEAKLSFVLLGCMDQGFAYAVPRNVIHPLLPALNTTTTDRYTYWHLHIVEVEPGVHALLVPKQEDNLLLAPYKIALEA